MATNVIFTRGNTATINATAITDGQILYNTTAGTQYLDNGTTRIQVGQNITVDTTLNSLSNNPIANRGVAGVMMSSLSEISTVTQAGSLPDALAVKELNNNLTANNTPFYYDYQNSQYGYNTSANRGADTFHPFSDLMTKNTDFQVGSFNPVSGERTLFTLSGGKGYNDLILKMAFVITPQDVLVKIKDSSGNILSSDTWTIVDSEESHQLKQKLSLSVAGNITVTLTQLGYIAGVQNFYGAVLNAYN